MREYNTRERVRESSLATNLVFWYATRQVDKLNNENFSFPVLYVPGFFMLHFEVLLCDTPLVSGYLSFAEPVC